MNREEELESISKKILILKREKNKFLLYDIRAFTLYTKGGLSILIILISIAIALFSTLTAFYLNNRDRIILWTILGLITIISLFITYKFLRKVIIDKQIDKLEKKIPYIKERRITKA